MKEKKSQISALFLIQRPPDDWPDAFDLLAIGLVANKCKKLAKISEILLLSLGLSYMKIPLCSRYVIHNMRNPVAFSVRIKTTDADRTIT